MSNIKVVYGNTELRLEEGYTITKSSQNIEYSDIICDFTDKTKEDLPEKYQEVKIMDLDNNKILAYGYIDDYNFGAMRETDLERDINISLLTPKKIATLRTATAVGTYNIKDLIENRILKPLLDDGFVIKNIDISNTSVKVNYLAETVEYCMNDLSNKFAFWWYIDENKNIYITDISLMLNKKPNYIYDDTHKISGLEYINPMTQSNDYANVVNFTNVRIYEYSRFNENETHNKLIDSNNVSMKKGDYIEFNFPIDIKAENIIKSAESNGKIQEFGMFEQTIVENYGIGLSMTYTIGGNTKYVYIIATKDGKYIQSNEIGIDGNERDTNKELLLVRDSFFSNLIVGIKNNSEQTITNINFIDSDSILVWNVNKFYNDKGIQNKKDIISKTGIVETTVNMNETWHTIQELTEIGKNYIDRNSISFAEKVEMQLDNDMFKIGDIIHINKFFIDDNYVVTKIIVSNSNNDNEYTVTCSKANMLSNFIDLFRSEITEIDTQKTYQLYVTHYEEEEIREKYEVVR